MLCILNILIINWISSNCPYNNRDFFETKIFRRFFFFFTFLIVSIFKKTASRLYPLRVCSQPSGVCFGAVPELGDHGKVRSIFGDRAKVLAFPLLCILLPCFLSFLLSFCSLLFSVAPLWSGYFFLFPCFLSDRFLPFIQSSSFTPGYRPWYMLSLICLHLLFPCH